MKKIYLVLYICILSFQFSCNKFNQDALKNGDLIFHESKSSQSKIIKLVTKSRYTHMGIIFVKSGIPYVYEAVQPVKITPFDEFVKRGRKKHFVIKRLKLRKDYLTEKNIKKMYKIGESFLNKNYDIYFKWSDKDIYCSELVWKIYYRAIGLKLGELETFNDYDLTGNGVQKLIKQRYGNKINLNELVITPSQIFESDELYTVYSN